MSKEHAKPAGRIVNIDGRDRRPWALQTRDKILNAAVEEIAERGFERARLVDIAERAGVTVGSIYTWYRDKTDLFTAALDHAIEEQRSNNERILSLLPDHGNGAWTWKIAAMVPRNTEDETPSATQRLLVEAVYAAWQNEEARGTILPRLATLLSQYREVVQEGRRDGSIDPKFDTELLAMMFMALPVGLSALNLAGLERPRDLHWIAVYEAFRQALLPRASTD
ncbi:MAG: TetR/AcrR family transcriptional regulator [Ilumatobacteraceae bacterium]|jgi:AcrR family transcriptional regulator